MDFESVNPIISKLSTESRIIICVQRRTPRTKTIENKIGKLSISGNYRSLHRLTAPLVLAKYSAENLQLYTKIFCIQHGRLSQHIQVR